MRLNPDIKFILRTSADLLCQQQTYYTETIL